MLPKALESSVLLERNKGQVSELGGLMWKTWGCMEMFEDMAMFPSTSLTWVVLLVGNHHYEVVSLRNNE